MAARRVIRSAFLTLTALNIAATSLTTTAGDLAFRRHVINADSEFMAAAVYDVNKDGKLDIACGGFWYEAPAWKRHFLRNVEVQGNPPRPDGYAHQVLDVNGDGWPDLVTVNWRSRSVRWIEHPGAELSKEPEWKSHVVATPGNMETGRLCDILGDGTPCVLPSTVPYWWELVRKSGSAPEWIQHELPRQIAGHGVGFGDVNGDGRGDVVGHAGWLEAPVDRRNGKWVWHGDFELGQTSVPILVVDVDGDGLNDLVWTMGHDYGVYWLQQSHGPSGQIQWTRRAIDTSWAGSHAPLWVDLDGDGTPELVVGRRYLAHEGRDPGEFDPQAIYRYQFDRATRTWRRYLVSYNDGTCFGLDPVAVDLTGSGRLDLVFGGRHGLYWMENLGPGNSVARHETKDPLWFPQYRDHSDLMVVKDESGAERPVKTAFDAGQRRAQTQAAIQAVLGTLPDSYRRAPLDVKVLGESKADGYTRRKITYASDPTSRVTAYLLVPGDAKPGGRAVICLHDDTPLGKDEPAGLGGRESMHYADELARRGFVCLVPDYPTYGEDHYDLKAHADKFASGAMKAVWDNLRGIDLLETLPEVNPKRIGILGHGLGGQNALLTAALDYRVSAVASSCGFTSFNCYHGGDLTPLADPRQMPRLASAYGLSPARVPFDFAEVLASLVPRPVYLYAPLRDPIDGAEGVRRAVDGATPIYQLRRAQGALKLSAPDAGRDFPADARAEVYAWLEQRLVARAAFVPRDGGN